MDWHDANTWGGSLPVAGQAVTLPANSKVVVTKSVTPLLGLVTIPSTSELILGENAAGITVYAKGFEVNGALTMGSESCRIQTEIIITLHGARPSDIATNPRAPSFKGVSVNGGTLNLHGKRYFRTWTRLSKTVDVGESILMLQHSVNWEPGQQIVLVTTAMKDSREWHQNEVLEVAALHPNPPSGVGTVVYLATPVKYKHVANKGYQAEVGLLTRTIKIQGARDSEPIDPDPLTCTGRWVNGNKGRPCPGTELTGYGGHMIVHKWW